MRVQSQMLERASQRLPILTFFTSFLPVKCVSVQLPLVWTGLCVHTRKEQSSDCLKCENRMDSDMNTWRYSPGSNIFKVMLSLFAVTKLNPMWLWASQCISKVRPQLLYHIYQNQNIYVPHNIQKLHIKSAYWESIILAHFWHLHLVILLHPWSSMYLVWDISISPPAPLIIFSLHNSFHSGSVQSKIAIDHKGTQTKRVTVCFF